MSFAKISSIAILGLLVGHFATYCCAEVTFDIITLSPLLWNETVQDVGNEIVDVVVLDRPLKHFNEKLARHFYAMVSAACILTVLNMAVPIVWMFRQYRRKTPPYQPIQFTKLENRNDTGIYAPIPPNPWRLGHYKYMQGAFAYTFFYTIFVITGFLFIYSCKQFVRTLQRWIPSISWGFAYGLVQALGWVIIIINTLLLGFLWLQALEMRFMIRGTYQRIVQQPSSSSCTTDTTSTTANKEDVYTCFRGERFHVPQYWNPLLVDCLFRCSFALLFLSMLFSLVCFLVGVWTVGSQFAVIHACGIAATTVQKVFCLELDWLGFPQVKCGKDFHILCKEWSDVDFTGMLWSGFLAFVIHFYLVASTGFAAHQRRSIPALLAQYNLVVQSVQRPEQPEQTPPPPSKQPQLSEQPLTIVERTAGSVAT